MMRMPPLMLRALEAWAAEMGTNRSHAFRDCLASALRERGHWPPDGRAGVCASCGGAE